MTLNVALSPHAATPHPRIRKNAIAGSALADAFCGTVGIRPGLRPNAPINASAKAGPYGNIFRTATQKDLRLSGPAQTRSAERNLRFARMRKLGFDVSRRKVGVDSMGVVCYASD
jgi:hypothetical protein